MRTEHIVGIAMVSLLAAGCSTTLTAKGQETSNQKVAALESQVGTLGQRVEELSRNQEAIQAELRTARPARTAPATLSKTSSAQKLSVRQVQRGLASAGFYQGPIDGKNGPKTQEAIKAFQHSQGLTADGKVGSKTSIALAQYIEE